MHVNLKFCMIALMVNCYEEIVTQPISYPNIREQQYIAYAMSCVQPGIDYFNSKFGDNTKSRLEPI